MTKYERISVDSIKVGMTLYHRTNDKTVKVLEETTPFRGDRRWVIKGTHPGARRSTITYFSLYANYVRRAI